MEQAAIIANLEVEQQNIIKAIEQKHLDDFILELLNNTYESEYYVQNKMKDFELTVSESYQLVLLHFENDKAILKNNLISQIKSLKQIYSNDALVYQNHDNGLSIIIARDFFDSTINELYNFMETHYSNIKVKGGMSRPYSIMELSAAYREAEIALAISRESQLQNHQIFLTNFENLNLERIMFSDKPSSEAQQIFNETLRKIMEYDDKYKSNLLNTLHSYLDCDLNIEKTSLKLFIHKNTVRYRLNSISSLLNINLDSLNTIILLKIAFTHFHFTKEYIL